jgi:hypothetical protein
MVGWFTRQDAFPSPLRGAYWQQTRSFVDLKVREAAARHGSNAADNHVAGTSDLFK